MNAIAPLPLRGEKTHYHDPYEMFHTQKVASTFSKAARQYDNQARIQKVIATAAINFLPLSLQGKGLDIGCGTGLHTAQLHQRGFAVQGVDVAEGMIRHASDNYPHIDFLQGSAQQLPLPNSSVDWIFSSMALQWCLNPLEVAEEFYRVMKPNSIAELSIMVAGSFEELHNARAVAGLPPALTSMPSSAQWLDAFLRTAFTVNRLITKVYVDRHPHVLGVLRSIKNVGAGVTHTPQQSLKKRDITTLDMAYRNLVGQQQCERGLPLSYLVSHFRLEKQ